MVHLADTSDVEGGWKMFLASHVGENQLPDDAPAGLGEALNAYRRAWNVLEDVLEPWL